MASIVRPVRPTWAPGLAEALLLALAIILLELALPGIFKNLKNFQPLNRTLFVRLIEIAILLGWFSIRKVPLRKMFYGPEGIRRSLFTAMAGCGILGVIAMGGEAALRVLSSKSFLSMVAGGKSSNTLNLLFVGALIGPLFEEIFFRGLLFAPLRKKTGLLPALLLTTLLFAAAHLPGGRVPWVQAVGGVFFCMALEYSGGLLAPFLIHALGNAAIFLLPYLL